MTIFGAAVHLESTTLKFKGGAIFFADTVQGRGEIVQITITNQFQMTDPKNYQQSPLVIRLKTK
jgi:hypothetical protein